MIERFDLVVIGSGPAGEKGAAQAAYYGKRVALVERDERVGGDATSHAVIPSKTLRETALYLTGFRRREVYGLSLDLDPETTVRHLAARTAEVGEASTQQVERNLARHRVTVVRGEATLGADRTVRVGDRVLHADAILIAAGSRPYHPPGIDFSDADIEDSQEILRLGRLPRSMVVVGGGAVGCEYASIFTALGTDVTLVDARDRLIPYLDGDASRGLAGIFQQEGMRVLTSTGVQRAERAGGALEVELDDGSVLRPEKLLIAAGRTGNVEGLGLDEAGVKADERGRILVDETYRTTAEGIYAAGDVIGSPALASVGMEQARVAVCHALDIDFKDAVDRFAPFGVYTIPEVAMVGLTEEGAAEAGLPHETGTSPFDANPRAQISGVTDGFVKLVFRADDRTLLGAHMIGESATELIHVAQAVLHEGGTIDRFISATYNVPSRVDAYKYAAYDGLQRLNGRGTG